MYILENPVLQRELLVNLRMKRAFVLLFVYVALLGAVVFFAWPRDQRLDLTQSPEEARQLVNWFFLGQYVLMSLMVPSFAAGSITGEKERQTYEMLLASPMRPQAIVTGKLAAALCHLAVLVIASLPIVMLCLPLGGVSPYEVMATYLAMAMSVITFGMICLTASSYFTRTLAALVVSYLIILPMVILGVLVYRLFQEAGAFRLDAFDGVFSGRLRRGLRVVVLQDQPAPAASARRRGRGQRCSRSRRGTENRGGHDYPQQPVSRQTVRPAQADRGDEGQS